MLGGVVSTTETLKFALPLLPAMSCAEHETDVVPSGNVLPEEGVHETDTSPSTASVAETAYVTLAPPEEVASTALSEAPAKTGGVMSRMSTVQVSVLLRPRLSAVVNSNCNAPSS